MKQKNPKTKVLPDGFYTIEDTTVWLNQGPYRGVSFEIGKIKIRVNQLTGQPNLCYDYSIVDPASFDATLLRSDPKLTRIIAAIIVDEVSDGGTFESILNGPDN